MAGTRIAGQTLVTRATIGPDSVLHHAGQRYRASLGKSGIRAYKQEGDGATPLGVLPIRRLLYRADRLPRPGAIIASMPLAPHDGWCDDPNDPAYNHPVRLPYLARHELLWRNDDLYDVIGILGWNDSPPVRDFGSAIFLHLARPDYAPTEGCIALARKDLLTLLDQGLTEIETTL